MAITIPCELRYEPGQNETMQAVVTLSCHGIRIIHGYEDDLKASDKQVVAGILRAHAETLRNVADGMYSEETEQ